MSYEVVFCIVNNGFSEDVMSAARKMGAQGGTIIRARGTLNKEAEQFFNIPLQEEKEVVMMIVPTSIKENILHTLYNQVGLETPGQGIAFCMPVDDVIGLTPIKEIK